MPLTDKDKEYKKEYMKQYMKEYRIKNKEYCKEYNKEYSKEYRIKNKEHCKEYGKGYSQTENGKKSRRISDWKRQGIIYHDYDILYDIYINTKNCDDCNCFLTQDKKTTSTTRCLDHDHSITDNENVRGVVCHSCNCKRG
jgi:hypothetical protein